MPRLTLGERLTRTQNQKKRGQQIIDKAEQEAAAIREQQRKERTRKLAALGGLVVKVGLDELSSAALLGGLMKMATDAKDPAIVAQWERAGGLQFHREEDKRVIAIARFTRKTSMELSAQLRGAGFRWNRYLMQWEGKVDLPTAKELVEGAGGLIQEVAPEAQTAPQPTPPAPRPPGTPRGPQPG